MIKNIFFDLDGTLLPLDIDTFVKGYFTSLAENFKEEVKPELLIESLKKALFLMLKNDGKKTNEEVFMDSFLKDIKKDRQEIDPLLQDFYEKEFPKLDKFAGFSELSEKIVSTVQKKGYRLVLATNPIFPKKATEHRMKWAGIDRADWSLYTTYEDFHFCKPNPKYFLEICEKLGLKPEETIMIGNDEKEDMIAKTLGMKTFLVTDYLLETEDAIEPDYRGDLEDLLAFVEKLEKRPDSL